MSTKAFSPRSIWNTKLADNAAVVSNSTQVAAIIAQVRATKTSTPLASYYNPPYTTPVNQGSYSCPVWVVDQSVPAQKVTLRTNNGSGPPISVSDPLQVALSNVPLPPVSPLEADGSDKAVIVWRPSTDELWEMWHFTDQDSSLSPSGPSCGWGGYMPHVSRHPGYYAPSARTNFLSWGVRASAFSVLGGLMRLDEIASGTIGHALVCSSALTANTRLAPAQRNDSGTYMVGSPSTLATYALIEGVLFRFPPGPTPSGLSAGAKLLYEAIRDYGLYVGDTDGAGVTLYIEDSKPLSTPYTDSTNLTNPSGTPTNSSMQELPWETIQQVQWTNPLPAGKRFANYSGQLVLIEAF